MCIVHAHVHTLHTTHTHAQAHSHTRACTHIRTYTRGCNNIIVCTCIAYRSTTITHMHAQAHSQTRACTHIRTYTRGCNNISVHVSCIVLRQFRCIDTNINISRIVIYQHNYRGLSTWLTIKLLYIVVKLSNI